MKKPHIQNSIECGSVWSPDQHYFFTFQESCLGLQSSDYYMLYITACSRVLIICINQSISNCVCVSVSVSVKERKRMGG